MLDAMRRGVTNLFTKFLLALLVVAFAIWGIGDVVRRTSQGALATVGKTEITVEEFRQAYQDEMESISRRLGRRLTPEQAKLLGIETRALARLIGFAAIDIHGRELHLGISEPMLANIIRNDPAFHGPNNQFSRTKFREVTRQIGFSEDQYIQGRRRDILREQLTDTLADGLAPQPSLIDTLHRYREETRVVEYITPNFDKVITIPEPDESKLREAYQQAKRQYVALERRKINLLLLPRDEALARTIVTDEEIKVAYEAEKESFNIPEKRRVAQLTFPDKAAAEKAYAELAKAKNFDEAADKLGFKAADVDLGVLTRPEMIDPRIAEAAFALKKDELSRPVEGQFSVALLRVSEIEPGKQRTFDEVKGEIRDRIAGERVGHELQALHDKAENERSKGKPLKEIAELLKVPLRAIEDIDRHGKSSEGKAAVEHADAARIAEAVFEASPGVETDTLELTDGGYAWYEVLSVTPEKQRTFDEVKAEVKSNFIEGEKRKEIAAFASKQIERLKGGLKLDGLAKELGAKIERTKAITRTTTPQGLTQNAVQQAFSLPKGGAASAATPDGKSRTIFSVAEIMPAPAVTPEQTDAIKAELTKQLRADVLEQYVAALRTRYTYSVNEKVLKQSLGPQQEQQQDSED
jgi:peptidyl-prolyl cis-trans isomerase D